jgi:ribonuclease HII
MTYEKVVQYTTLLCYNGEMEKSCHTTYIVGIDEAGRGPLAGPVTVGLVAVPEEQYKKVVKKLEGIRDSKKLSEAQRVRWRTAFFLTEFQSLGMFITTSSVGAKSIDKMGINRSISRAVARVLERVPCCAENMMVYLDGLLVPPQKFIRSKTIIRGDTIHPLIMAASVVAKVTRDRKMLSYDKIFPEYHFRLHKGYGTFLHDKMIQKYGLSTLHRKSFTTKFQ